MQKITNAGYEGYDTPLIVMPPGDYPGSVVLVCQTDPGSGGTKCSRRTGQKSGISNFMDNPNQIFFGFSPFNSVCNRRNFTGI